LIDFVVAVMTATTVFTLAHQRKNIKSKQKEDEDLLVQKDQ
jgi:hypothetical protein